MQYAIIGIVIIVIIFGAIMIFRKLKKKPNEDTMTTTVESSDKLSIIEPQVQEMVIQMEMLPAESIPPESKLVEITDRKVIAYIDNLIPGLMRARNAVCNKKVRATQAKDNVLYRAVIPAGAKLANSKSLKGAVRGFFHGTNGIKGQANLIPVKVGESGVAIPNTAVAAISLAFIVVGLYYMTQIDSKLSEISDGISKISDFQDNEYRSRVFSLLTHVKKIADFQTEILENNELRLSKIAQLDSLEEECTKLLGQANLTLVGYAKKNDLDYEAYEKELHKAYDWFRYQQSLLDVLIKISDLRYTLHLGAVSRKQCTALLPTYIKQVNDTQKRLTEWHKNTAERLDISTEKFRRRRTGFDGIIYFVPGIFNDDLNFCSIEESTVQMIVAQRSGNNNHQQDNSDLYSEDVQLIAKDGKVYYLPTINTAL